VVLAPVLDGSARVGWRSWLVEAFLLEAIARDALGDPPAAYRAVERALDLAEPDGALLWFLLHPRRACSSATPGSAPRMPPCSRRSSTCWPETGRRRRLPGRVRRSSRSGKSEIRVLRYLPTHLSAPEIAGELSVSTTTVKTHLRNLYAKLGAHRRAEAVESGRALGLLAPSAHQR
jgi:LuxR family maltose regulon positive regulatory protein